MTTNQPAARRAPQKRTAETKEKILKATIELLAEVGAPSITHRAIAERAGTSLAATTYHFKDKPEILAEAYRWMIDHYIEEYRTSLPGDDSGYLSQEELYDYLVKVYLGETKQTKERRIAWYEFMIESYREPALQPIAEAWYSETIDFYRGLFERAGSNNPPIDAREYVDFLVGFQFGYLSTGDFPLEGVDPTLLLTRLLDSMFKPHE